MYISSLFYITSWNDFIDKLIVKSKIKLYLTRFMHKNWIGILFKEPAIGGNSFLIYPCIHIFLNNTV